MVGCIRFIIQRAWNITREAKASFIHTTVSGRGWERHGPPELLGIGWFLLAPLLTTASGSRESCAAGTGTVLSLICLFMSTSLIITDRLLISLTTRVCSRGPKEKESSHVSEVSRIHRFLDSGFPHKLVPAWVAYCSQQRSNHETH